MVHAETEEIRLVVTIGHERRVGCQTIVHVPPQPEEQSRKVQTRPPVR